MPNLEAKAVLEQTRELLIHEENWAKKTLLRQGEIPRYCLLGALGVAKGFSDKELEDESSLVYKAALNSDGSGRILAEVIVDYVQNNEFQSKFSYQDETYVESMKGLWNRFWQNDSDEEDNEEAAFQWRFNDLDATTHEDVIKVLDLAIGRASR